MKFTALLYVVLAMMIIAGCKQEDQKQEISAGMAAGAHKIVAEEVIHTSAYTYIKAREGDQEYWLAVTRREVQTGATLYYTQAMEMKNFASKDLDRTFDSILFVEKISDQPADVAGEDIAKAHSGAKNVAREELSVKPAKGGVTIGGLYAKKSEFRFLQQP